MTQSEEALEMMSCARCGRYSGPEQYCTACERLQDTQHLEPVQAALAALVRALADTSTDDQDMAQYLDWLLHGCEYAWQRLAAYRRGEVMGTGR